MAVERIPATERVICDGCLREIKTCAGLFLKGNICDIGYDGAAGGCQVRYDFCTGCRDALAEWLTERLKRFQQGA